MKLILHWMKGGHLVIPLMLYYSRLRTPPPSIESAYFGSFFYCDQLEENDHIVALVVQLVQTWRDLFVWMMPDYVHLVVVLAFAVQSDFAIQLVVPALVARSEPELLLVVEVARF